MKKKDTIILSVYILLESLFICR